MTIINTKNLFLFSFFVYLVTSFLDIFYTVNDFWLISASVYSLLIFVWLFYIFFEGSNTLRFDGFLLRYFVGSIFYSFQFLDYLWPGSIFYFFEFLDSGYSAFCVGLTEGSPCPPYDPNSYSIFLNIIFYLVAISTLRNNNQKIPVKK